MTYEVYGSDGSIRVQARDDVVRPSLGDYLGTVEASGTVEALSKAMELPAAQQYQESFGH